MSLSDDIDRERDDLDWREYDAEGTNEATLAAYQADPEWFKWVFPREEGTPPTTEMLDRWRYECRDWADDHTGVQQHLKAVILGLLEEIERLKVADIASRNPGIDTDRVRAERQEQLRKRMRELRYGT